MADPYDLEEAAGVLEKVAALFAGLTIADALCAALLSRLAAALEADADIVVTDATAGDRLAAMADPIIDALPSLDSLIALVDAIVVLPAVSEPAQAVRAGVEWIALALVARRLAEIEFRSHDETERLKARLAVRFDGALVRASAASEPELTRTVKALFAAVVEDLSLRGRVLPRLVTYRRPEAVPHLVLAHGLYYDAARGAELVEENAAVNPVFMPVEGKALSA